MVKKFIHSRPQNRTLKGADGAWPLSISLRETVGKSPRSFIFYLFVFCIIVVFSACYCVAQVRPQKAVFIIASEGFRDEELLLPKDMFETNRIEVTLASLSTAPARGVLGTIIKPDILLTDIQIDDYDALVFVGGPGAKEYWDDETAHRLIVQANQAKKIIGAICIAPVTLARAGILEGKKATVWPELGKTLEAGGAIYTGNDLEEDGNIITANGPQAADKFGEALIKALIRRR